MSRLCICLSLTLLLASAALSQSEKPAVKHCSQDVFRQFDFWVGEWEVRDAAGKEAGRNTISLEQNGCLLTERWVAKSGGTGMSMNYYDPRTSQWKQNWVSPGTLLEMSGAFANGAMTLEGPLQSLDDGRVTLLRGVWTQLPDGRVRQRFTESSDMARPGRSGSTGTTRG